MKTEIEIIIEVKAKMGLAKLEQAFKGKEESRVIFFLCDASENPMIGEDLGLRWWIPYVGCQNYSVLHQPPT